MEKERGYKRLIQGACRECDFTKHEEQGIIIKESVATTQEEEHDGTTNEVCVQNTAPSLHMGKIVSLRRL